MKNLCTNNYVQRTFISLLEILFTNLVLLCDLLLVPVLAGIFMVHLERTLLPELEKFMKPWKRQVDDTITYIKPDFITDVIDILNKFHQNIKFTNEVKHNGKISFLDVLLMRFNGKLETFVRKLVTTYIWIGDLSLPRHGKRLH